MVRRNTGGGMATGPDRPREKMELERTDRRWLVAQNNQESK